MEKSQIIKTRIAPSPTGFLHIGTARTALFNYLFAKHGKGKPRLNRNQERGKFILRIEDTDVKRSTKEYEKDIVEGLKWLGLEWNSLDKFSISPPTPRLRRTSNFQFSNKSQITNSKQNNQCRQSERLGIYRKYADLLIKKEIAYKKDGAIWFRLDSYPNDIIKYHDLIMGDLEFKKEVFNDFVLIKSDGIPLYMFAAVIDDHEMGITHIIRGDDHINSTPQQIMLYNLLGWDPPQFAHIPLILNEDRSKMSKRKNPVSITRDFRDKGYLPEAMINYMAFLGWNPKTEKEFFSLDELVEEFDLKKVNKSGAIFDIKKLNYFNNHYIRNLSDDKLLQLIMQNAKCKMQNNNSKFKTNRKFLLRVISIVKNRMDTLLDFDELSNFFFRLSDYKPSLLVFKKSDKEKTLKGLNATCYMLHTTKDIDWKKVENLNKILLSVVKDNNLTNGDVFWPIRVALSGQEKSPSPPELLWALGKKESLKRIKIAVEKI